MVTPEIAAAVDGFLDRASAHLSPKARTLGMFVLAVRYACLLKGGTVVSVKRVAARWGATERAVWRACRQAEKVGLVSYERGKPWRSAKISICPERTEPQGLWKG